MSGVAFFDFDNTLIHGDAGPLFGQHLYVDHRRERGFVRTYARYLPFFSWMSVQAAFYKAGAVRRSTIVRNAYRGLKGVPVAHLNAALADFVADVIPQRRYPEMVREITQHQAAGRRVVVVTTGMEVLVRLALQHFPPGIDVIGCRLAERNGRLTGKVTGTLYGVDKANILTAYTRALGMSLEDCWAYSDHYSDKEMLEVVGHGVAVNPRGALRRLAKKRGWTILDLPEPA
jgi:alcohol-forming fatty acyl-CoA reductase